MSIVSAPLAPLLAAHEAPPYWISNPNGNAPIVLTCDHAANAVPEQLNRLGLDAGELDRHIAWDRGAAELTLRLGARFDAPAILSRYSRLVIDCNRKPESESSIPPVSDSTKIPGNLNLSKEHATQRVEGLFLPYHRAITRALDAVLEGGRQPIFVAIHSFTRRLRNGFARPWHYGVLWDEDPRVAPRLVAALRRTPGLVVGDNEPYSGRDHFDFSQDYHAGTRGIASALVEVREDLIRDEAGLDRHARILGDALATVFTESGLYEAGL